jgi:Bacterial virulence factor lipase N-terminal
MCRRAIPITFALFFLGFALTVAPAAHAKEGVQARFELVDPAGVPFPSDRFTVPDAGQLTGLRVSLPKPDCSLRPSDCDDIDVLNTLDGFNLQPRLSVPFTGPIDPASVTSQTVFLFRLGLASAFVGINQVVWDPDGNALYVESDALLDQDARYLFVVTDGVRNASGDPVGSTQFRKFLSYGQTMDAADKAYRAVLLEALDQLEAAGVSTGRVAVASVFTTQSATAILENTRDQLDQKTPAPAEFELGPNGERSAFPLADVAGIAFNRQITTAPTFSTSTVAINVLKAAGGTVGRIAFGRYRSPDYQTPARVIPAVGTRGTPVVQGVNEVYFNLVLPAGNPPAGGWPVAIVGHGFGDGNKNGLMPLQNAAALAQRGTATVTFNGVGAGGGPLGTLVVTKADGSTVVLSAGGRGRDDDGDGVIFLDEGAGTVPGTPQALVSRRDGIAQTVIDAMQVVRVIQAGIDIDGDSLRDLDPSRISFHGNSGSAIWGTDFVALEPAVRAAVLRAGGGPIVDAGRLGFFRPAVGQLLAERAPSLLNDGPVDPFTNTLLPFDENIPLRNRPPVVTDVRGAMAIQQQIDRFEWAMQSSNPVAYAPHLRKQPLPGVTARPVLIMFAKGDKTVPNPTETAVVRAGELADRTLYFRYDLALANGLPHFPNDDPHPATNPTAIATFLTSDGSQITDPDGPGPVWQQPIAGPLPEDLSFIGTPYFLPGLR